MQIGGIAKGRAQRDGAGAAGHLKGRRSVVHAALHDGTPIVQPFAQLMHPRPKGSELGITCAGRSSELHRSSASRCIDAPAMGSSIVLCTVEYRVMAVVNG